LLKKTRKEIIIEYIVNEKVPKIFPVGNRGLKLIKV
tara:strand:+ start:501 stop:608 length:108 start_codon:yes stop_codon:yes gene_type:complete